MIKEFLKKRAAKKTHEKAMEKCFKQLDEMMKKTDDFIKTQEIFSPEKVQKAVIDPTIVRRQAVQSAKAKTSFKK